MGLTLATSRLLFFLFRYVRVFMDLMKHTLILVNSIIVYHAIVCTSIVCSVYLNAFIIIPNQLET